MHRNFHLPPTHSLSFTLFLRVVTLPLEVVLVVGAIGGEWGGFAVPRASGGCVRSRENITPRIRATQKRIAATSMRDADVAMTERRPTTGSAFTFKTCALARAHSASVYGVVLNLNSTKAKASSERRQRLCGGRTVCPTR